MIEEGAKFLGLYSDPKRNVLSSSFYFPKWAMLIAVQMENLGATLAYRVENAKVAEHYDLHLHRKGHFCCCRKGFNRNIVT